MNYEEFVYRDILVRLMQIKNLEGWYAEIKDKKYGNYFEIHQITEKPHIFDVLKDNAKETINALLK